MKISFTMVYRSLIPVKWLNYRILSRNWPQSSRKNAHEICQILATSVENRSALFVVLKFLTVSRLFNSRFKLAVLARGSFSSIHQSYDCVVRNPSRKEETDACPNWTLLHAPAAHFNYSFAWQSQWDWRIRSRYKHVRFHPKQEPVLWPITGLGRHLTRISKLWSGECISATLFSNSWDRYWAILSLTHWYFNCSGNVDVWDVSNEPFGSSLLKTPLSQDHRRWSHASNFRPSFMPWVTRTEPFCQWHSWSLSSHKIQNDGQV